MEGYTGIPTNIEEYMNFSMLTQAEGLKYGIEHYRRNKHRTSGSLIWQLNDSWPGTSWSLIDYELLPKASFYYATKFYHPLLLSIDHEPGQDLAVWAVNDTLSALNGQVHVSVYNFSGEQLFTHSFEAAVGANTAIQLGSLPEAAVLNGALPEQVVVRVHTTDWAAPDNLHYLRDQKDLQFPATSLSINVDADTQAVHITANGAHARMVKLDLPQGNIRFSDNFFDLRAGEQVTVYISDPTGDRVDLSNLSVSAMNS